MFSLTNLLARQGYFGEHDYNGKKPVITWHYDSNYFYYDCDRTKNTECPRVKNGLPCGDCKGTTNIECALVKLK